MADEAAMARATSGPYAAGSRGDVIRALGEALREGDEVEALRHADRARRIAPPNSRYPAHQRTATGTAGRGRGRSQNPPRSIREFARRRDRRRDHRGDARLGSFHRGGRPLGRCPAEICRHGAGRSAGESRPADHQRFEGQRIRLDRPLDRPRAHRRDPAARGGTPAGQNRRGPAMPPASPAAAARRLGTEPGRRGCRDLRHSAPKELCAIPDRCRRNRRHRLLGSGLAYPPDFALDGRPMSTGGG